MDIAQGVAGAAIAAMTGVLVSRIIGRNAYIWLAIIVAVVAFITSLLLLTFNRPESTINCVQPATPVENTNLVLIQNFSQTDNTLVTTSFGSLCMFDSKPDERLIDLNAVLDLNTTKQLVATKNNNLLLTGGGLISAELTGLRKALSTNRELTFGVNSRQTDSKQIDRHAWSSHCKAQTKHRLLLLYCVKTVQTRWQVSAFSRGKAAARC